MNVTLSAEFETLIQEKIESGRFKSAEEVIKAALLQLDDVPSDRDQLRAEVAKGFQQLDRGEGLLWRPERMEELKLKATENARLRKPIKDAVKP